MDFIVTDKQGKRIKAGDTVTNFRGEPGTFQKATRVAQPGKSAKVVVNGCEYYAEGWGLVVEEEGSIATAALAREVLTELRRLRDTRPQEWDALVDPGLLNLWDRLKEAAGEIKAGA